METKNSVLTTGLSDDQLITATVNILYNYHKADNKRIRSYMPLSIQFRAKHLLLLLIAVRALNKPCKENVIDGFNLNEGSAIKGIDYLCANGFISAVARPRLIIPFQKYKVDTGYVITEKGERVLRDILLG